MSKIAFVFSGQGAQKAGMGRSFYDNAEEVKTLYDAAENIRPGTIAQSFEGSDAELCLTVNTQPCLYLCDLAAAVTLNSLGVKADAAAGFSLGEIPALAYSGAYSYTDGFVHAIRRGEYMAKAAEANPASMAAILKLSDEAVIEICNSVGAWPVNFNCPGQVSAAFTSDKLSDKLSALTSAVREAGGKLIPLKVSGGFHSPLMTSASEEFGEYLESAAEVSAPSITAYSNVTGEAYTDDVKSLLTRQINSPVLWTKIIRNMADSGVDTFIECGVGTTLKGLITKILPEAKVYSATTYEEAKEAAANVQG